MTVMACEYSRGEPQTGFDDMFNNISRHGSKCKELKAYRPHAPTSQTQLHGASVMTTSCMDIDTTDAMKYKPTKRELTGGKTTVPNVTHMRKYGNSGEFGDGNTADSTGKHVGFRVRDI